MDKSHIRCQKTHFHWYTDSDQPRAFQDALEERTVSLRNLYAPTCVRAIKGNVIPILSEQHSVGICIAPCLVEPLKAHVMRNEMGVVSCSFSF
jgi:hypothetical protein